MFLVALFTSFLSLSLLASTKISSGIYDIDLAKNNQSDHLILLETGQVAKIPAGKSHLLNTLQGDFQNKKIYNFILDNDRYIVEAIPIAKKLKSTISNTKVMTYIPTTIPSMSLARKYFREARYNPKDSQCFNRAMIWSFEWWRNHSLKSNKILIYWTRTYIRRYNFEWWFHIAPYVHIMDEGKVVERVMDVKYTRGPIDFRKWTNIFTNRDPECLVISKFSEYADNPYTGDCYIQRTNMYTYQPADLQMNEAWNYVKDNFVFAEIKQAYLEAFDEVFNKNERD